MMEISNHSPMNFFAQAAKAQGVAMASTTQVVAQTFPEQANIAAKIKAGNSNFTPSEAVQKEVSYWENFTDRMLNSAKKTIENHNRLLSHDDAYWAQKEAAFGPEFVEFSRNREQKELERTPSRLESYKNAFNNNDFNIDGNLFEMNELGEYHFGDFSLSKEGLGYEFFMDSSGKSEITYAQSNPFKVIGPYNKLDNNIQSLLFKENHR